MINTLLSLSTDVYCLTRYPDRLLRRIPQPTLDALEYYLREFTETKITTLSVEALKG